MKTTIIYHSLFGNTEKIAQAIAKGCKGDVTLRQSSDISQEEIESSDLLIVGSPTHGGRFSEQIAKFFANLHKIPTNKKIKAASFNTGIPSKDQPKWLQIIIKFFGYASKHISAKLKASGFIIVAEETFWVLGKEGPLETGELERAQKWGEFLTT